MSVISDFRLARTFDPDKVDSSGRFLGRTVYWKLYFVENAFRVIIDSVLSAQLDRNWWETAVDLRIREDAEKIRIDYFQNPQHSMPGRHRIYFVFLRQLGEIIRANSNLFRPIIPNVDEWIVKLEQLRLPRNIVGHMNFPREADRALIDEIYSDCRALIRALQNLEDSGLLALKIP